MELLVLKIKVANAVPDPAPSLLDSNFVEPANLQLLFRPSGKYAASTHFIHIQVPFNFSQLLATPQNIFKQYHKNTGLTHKLMKWQKSAALASKTR
jgi:hypothetical protein